MKQFVCFIIIAGIITALFSEGAFGKPKEKTPEEMTEESDVIVEGKVVSVENDVSGFPRVRRIIFEITKAVKGSASGKITVLQLRPEDDPARVYPLDAQFTVGENAKLYLVKLDDPFLHDFDGKTKIPVPAGTNYWVHQGSQGKEKIKIKEDKKSPEKEKKPSAELEKKIDELIKKLGDEKYKEREAAQKELTKIGRPALDQLKEAQKNKDPEVQKRAKKIIADIKIATPPDVDGIKLILKANKKTYKKNDKFVLSLEWKNSGKEDIQVQSMLKANPYMALEIKGDLATNIGRWGMPPAPDLLADGPVTIKPDKSVTAKMDGQWSEAMFLDKDGNFVTETRLGLFDDEHVLGLKKGKYAITAKTVLKDGREVRSKPVKIEIK